MKLPVNHNTHIDNLIIEYEKNSNNIFLSDWNKPSCIPNFSQAISKKALKDTLENINKYFFIDEMESLKEWFCEQIVSNEKINLMSNYFAIAPNGTSGAMLSLQTLNMNEGLRPILLTPIYFSYINLLKLMGTDIEYYQIIKDGHLYIDYLELTDIIIKTNANILILNDPVFGSGVKITNDVYKKLISICDKYHMTLFVDYVYGGMEWNSRPLLLNEFLINNIQCEKPIIYIDSISKRLFTNGIKNSLVFANSKIIHKIEQLAVYTTGCITASQVSYFKELYNNENYKIVTNTIANNIVMARKNYSLLKTLISCTGFYMSNCESGYYCLMNIPYTLFKTKNNMKIAESILKSLGILTIPHDRYLYFDDRYYSFRMNLTVDKNKLLISIDKLLRFLKEQ